MNGKEDDMAERFKKAKYYSEKYKSILKPCQECGNTDIRIVSDREVFPPKDAWSVCCSTDKCECTGLYTSVKKAIEAWNVKN